LIYTISKKIDIEGIGIHTGKRVKITLSPYDEVGVYLSLPSKNPKSKQIIRITSQNYKKSSRTSSIILSSGQITCPEHLFASLALTNVRAILIELPGPCELPVAPFSGESFYEIIMNSGLRPISKVQDGGQNSWNRFKLELIEDHRSYTIEPASSFNCQVNMTEGTDIHGVVDLCYEDLESSKAFVMQIARARTWVKESAIKNLQNEGLCKGIDEKWCQIVTPSMLQKREIALECTYHKLYDLLGDLFLVGYWPEVRIVSFSPNHRLNVALLHLFENIRKPNPKVSLKSG